jgi:glyoxylase-like metal-dependent hydrolase (beta-lactamase superfamily II)
MAEVLVVEGRMGAGKPVRTAIVRGTDTWLWIDAGIAGTPRDWILPELHRRGLSPPARNLLLISHCDVDHFGGAAELRSNVTGTVVAAHDADAKLMADLDCLIATRYDRFRGAGIVVPDARIAELRARAGAAMRTDLLLKGGEHLDVGDGEQWEVLHVPGHSAGHLALVSHDHALAFAGDAAMGWGVVDATGNLQPPHYIDVDAYLGSISRLEHLSLGTLQLAHETAVSGAALTQFLRSSREAVSQIGAAVAEAGARVRPSDPHRLRRICEAVHDELGHWPSAPAASLANSVSAHLDATS